MDLPGELEIARALPPAGCGLAEAQRYTRWLATHHYENFHVVSWLLPRRLHQSFFDVYSYCRWADDLGDEIADSSRALELLDWWERELDQCYAGQPSHPVFVALAPTVRAFGIPRDPFADLLRAFRQDQTVKRYQTWGELLGYCRYSANPVGRLVLYLGGYRDSERQRLSDATCTALQLANFWQDVSRDLEKGRIYLPLDALSAHGLRVDEVEAKRFDERYVSLMRDLIKRTRALFAEGLPLVGRVSPALRVDLDLFNRGGIAVLDAIETMGYDTLHHRPAIGTVTRVRLLGRAMGGRLRAALAPGAGRPGLGTEPEEERLAVSKNEGQAAAVQESYVECRRVARVAASNFYYAFFMMPRAKRDAFCALYAFMRLVDDVSDTPSTSTVAPESNATGDGASETGGKQNALARWRALLDAAVGGDTSGHPILPAFADTIRRYRIPPRYFHDILSGVEMDLTESRYATFERLREYCYRVAGAVGLACLHVFGFEDPHAPELAEKLGIAFQLTNIIRDVGADMALGRVYLPAEDLDRFGCSAEDLACGKVTPAVRELLRAEADRAWSNYADGARLISRVERDSRAALWALTRIYSSLLARIEERDFDVFSSRVRLSAAEKTRILVRARLGWWSEADVLEERDRDRGRTGGAFLSRRAG